MSTPPPSPQAQSDRSSSTPLLWILMLIALVAITWYWLNRDVGILPGPPVDLTAPAAISETLAPASNNASDAKAPAKKAAAKPPTKPKLTAKAVPINRDASLIGRPKPAYPPEAFRAGEEGTVMVQASIDANGTVSGVEIVRRSGSRALDRAAMSEVRTWKFHPAMKNGKTAAATVQVPVDYRLEKQ